MKALMLAAGMARRLYGDNNDELPKALLRFQGQSLLQRHIELLQAYGFEQLTLIVGHRHDELLKEAETVARPGFIDSVYNPRYREGPVLSLSLGGDVLRSGSDVLFMDADVLYHPLLLEKLVSSPHHNCMIFDRQFQSTDDFVKVCVEGDRVVEFGKGIQRDDDAVGEWPGFLKINPATAAKVADAADELIAEGAIEGAYERAFCRVMERDPACGFGHEDITGIPWIEIDYPEDLAKAEGRTFPHIAEYLAEISVVEVAAD